jgi:hypothetical protein
VGPVVVVVGAEGSDPRGVVSVKVSDPAGDRGHGAHNGVAAEVEADDLAADAIILCREG